METPGGLIRLIVYLTPELEEELRDLAHERRRSKSEMIREAVAEHLKRLREGEG
ncbi:MAG TPA: CopG family transcriptional regulator [Thermoanaerobaculia bacterium]|nr:CopG family transcriptional regulator [Thermoanaerobaculia bacterium]